MKTNTIFNIGMLAALFLGGVFAYLDLSLVNGFANVVSLLFINMLKLISLPIIFLAIVSTLTGMTSLNEAGFLLRKIVKYTLLTTIVAALIGMILFLIIQPIKPVETTIIRPIPNQGSYFSFLLNIIPEHLVQPFMENNVLGIAFIGTIFGLAILKLPQKQSALLRDFFEALFAAILKITSTLILLMPLGIFAFTLQFVQSMRGETAQLRQLLLYSSCVIGANFIQGFIIIPLLLKFKKISPIKTARGMFPALAIAFFSKSSSAALPLTLDCAQNRLGISEKTANFSLPLCSIINMNGCAAFIAITLFFICSTQGIHLSIWEMIPWIFLSTLAAVGNAGVPMGCFFLTSAFLIGMGVSVEPMGMILPLYSLFDMIETALNVWSDSSITVIVDKELQ